MPVVCLLGKDLEDSPWKEVEHRSHLEMLGLPGWECVSIQSVAARQSGQELLEPERVAQWTAPEVPTVREEEEPEGDAPEPTGEQVAELGEVPELSQWQQEGGPTREVFCAAQRTCPTLDGLRQQVADQAAGKEPGLHLIYWEDDLLYSEPKVPEPGSAHVLVVPQCFRAFLLGLAHDVPLAGHMGQDKTFERLVTNFYWPLMRRHSDAHCRPCQTCQSSGKSGGKCKAPLQPLPIVSTPFERVGLDIVGPLDPKTAMGNRIILVLVVHGTRYPEAIPLRSITSPVAPVEPRVLQDKWTGPFEVVKRKSEVTYLVDLQSPRNPTRVLHVNRLKPHFEQTELSMLLATDDGVEEESEPLPDLLSAGEKDGSVEGVILSPSLTEEQQRDCRHVLGQFASLFSLIPGVRHLPTYDVDSGDSPPIKPKVYRVTDSVRACIKDEVSKMLTLGVIERSSSPWPSPVVLVPKSAAPAVTPELRFCVDYQGLNAVSKTDAHPIPRAVGSCAAPQYV
ncbi:hypothetical protein NDU88_001289 [Pleurodeles waltl]|uniref:Gypsy retrotransposon integrase-like protein 1 n=1 Tax=Pleurodeles waltl TaxID=8319 RepID=A0AAV7KQ09_PLEWA|nr:hypothetical protein NDU88_001289 [Pleurodeles waltl]